MKKLLSLLLIAFLLSACGGKKAPPIAAPAAKSGAAGAVARPAAPLPDIALPPSTDLPISASGWNRWQCADGSQIETRYQSADRRRLLLRYQGREEILEHEPSATPVVYESATTAFYSDGNSAVIGAPRSADVYSAGCVAH